MEHRSRCVLGRRNPCHVLQFAVDCGDRGVRVDTETCLPGKRDTVGASPDTRDAEYLEMSIAGLFLGARLGHCLIYEYAYYFAHPLEILLPIRVKSDGSVIFSGYQGMASHGGLVGWMIAMVIYSRITGENVLRTLDTIALVLPLAAGCIRLGNLANSEIIGIETNVSWAFVFEQIDSVPRHPAQIYEALAYFFIFGINLLLYRRIGLTCHRGVLLGNTLVWVFVARFLIEFVKERQVPFEDQMILDVGQVLSIPFILLGIFLLIRRFKCKKNTTR